MLVAIDQDAKPTEIDNDQNIEFFPDQESLLRFECSNANCFFATTDIYKLNLHMNTCRSTTNINCKQIAMGLLDESVRRQLEVEEVEVEGVRQKIIPSSEWVNEHFSTFDVECMMHKTVDGRGRPVSVHKLISIAVRNSFGEPREFYIERESMEPHAIRQMMQEFLANLKFSHDDMMDEIPESVKAGKQKYEKMVYSKDFKLLPVARQTVAREKLRYLKECTQLRVYSWNGERYDNNILWAPFLDVLQYDAEKDFEQMQIIRRGTGIMQFCYKQFIFRDFLNFSSPMSLDNFARSCGVTSAEKTTYPYEYFSTMEELRETREFPPYPAFKSSLAKPDKKAEEEMIKLVNENFDSGFWSTVDDVREFFGSFEDIAFDLVDGRVESLKTTDGRRIEEVFHTSPLKYYNSRIIFDTSCENMSDYLRLYNLNDVILLEACIKAYAKGFLEDWGFDIHSKMSLPGVSQGRLIINFMILNSEFKNLNFIYMKS